MHPRMSTCYINTKKLGDDVQPIECVLCRNQTDLHWNKTLMFFLVKLNAEEGPYPSYCSYHFFCIQHQGAGLKLHPNRLLVGQHLQQNAKYGHVY